MTNLRNARIGEIVKVVNIECIGALRRRIMDMGITKGTNIVIRKIAPFGDPIEIFVRGYELSLRKSDAEKIIVEYVESKWGYKHGDQNCISR